MTALVNTTGTIDSRSFDLEIASIMSLLTCCWLLTGISWNCALSGCPGRSNFGVLCMALILLSIGLNVFLSFSFVARSYLVIMITTAEHRLASALPNILEFEDCGRCSFSFSRKIRRGRIKVAH